VTVRSRRLSRPEKIYRVTIYPETITLTKGETAGLRAEARVLTESGYGAMSSSRGRYVR
jgi:hypothetical protein